MKRCLLCGEPAARETQAIEKLPVYLHAVAPELQADVPRLPFRAGLCDHCGHIQQLDVPEPEVIEEVYRRFFGTYQSTARTGIGGLRAGRFLEFVASNVELGGSVLEVGCHDGHFLSLLRDRGCTVAGCDPSAGATIASEELGIETRREFFRAGLYADRSFDLLVARQLLEHLERPLEFLRAARRVLRRGGLLALELPDAELWLGQGVIGSLFHEHVSYYTDGTLRALVEAAGFAVAALERGHTDLFLVARETDRPPLRTLEDPNEESVRLARGLLEDYERRTADKRQVVDRILHETHRGGGRAWLYGAGVHSSSMVAALGLSERQIDGVVDDNPGVHGKFLPNLSRPIEPPSRLLEADARDVAIVSGFSFQEEMLGRLEALGAPLRTVTLYPEVEFHARTRAAELAVTQGGAACS